MDLEGTQLELFPLKRVGMETGFSPYPFHTLSKKEGVEIEIQELDENGKLETIWEVSPNTKYGQPGILAYKIDTLVINRKIDELRPNVPRIIKLGSLREICKELGVTEGQNTQDIKKALHQNASAYITANIFYKTKEHEEEYIEFGATRYDVIFTGRKLPDGKKADAVYIVLHELFHDFLNKVQTRPLDYEYLKKLSPTAQRFYELISTQIYAHIKNKLPCAKLRYSEFCLYSPLTRYFDYDQVKKQMYKIHKPHREFGYIESINFEKTTDEDGKDDWFFSYTAGERAKREYRTFNTELKKIRKSDSEAKPVYQKARKPENQIESKLEFSKNEENLISRMREFKVAEGKARSLVKSHREAVEREISVFPYRLLGGAVKNLSGLFIAAVEEGYEAPQSYLESLEQAGSKKQSEAERKRNEEKDKARREEEELWKRANDRLNNLPEADRQKLSEATREKILSSPDYKDAAPQQLKVLESVMPGYIRSEIIETFIQEERQSSGK